MRWDAPPPAYTSERGLRLALLFAFTAESLSAYYEHGQWLTPAQGAQLMADWLSRSGRQLPLSERKQLAGLGSDLGRQIAGALSREAGLYTAHEMMEALDPNYHSDTGLALMAECERLLDAASQA